MYIHTHTYTYIHIDLVFFLPALVGDMLTCRSE